MLVQKNNMGLQNNQFLAQFKKHTVNRLIESIFT